MTQLKNLFIKPFVIKGPFWGIVDLVVKIIAAFLWIYLMGILWILIRQSVLLDYNPITQLWWVAYCFLICLTVPPVIRIIFLAVSEKSFATTSSFLFKTPLANILI